MTASKRKPAAPRGLQLTAVALRVLFTVAALWHVRARLQVVELGYRLSEAAARNHRLQEEQRRLMIEVATLRHPRRLRRIATGKLGLVEPRPEQIIRWRHRHRRLAAGGREGF